MHLVLAHRLPTLGDGEARLRQMIADDRFWWLTRIGARRALKRQTIGQVDQALIEPVAGERRREHNHKATARP